MRERPGAALARKSNDYGAQLVKDHPASFGLLAALPLPDPQGSLVEMEYALDTLHADGIALLSSYGDKWLGDATYAPVFEELNRRKAVVFVHPNAPNCCANLQAHVPASTMEFLFRHDSDDRKPAHERDFLPVSESPVYFFSRRGSHAHAGEPNGKALSQRPGGSSAQRRALRIEAPVLRYRQRKQSDLALRLLSIVPSSQVLFGSDFPFLSAGEPAGDLMHSGLPDNTVEAINRNNAVRLFGRLKG